MSDMLPGVTDARGLVIAAASATCAASLDLVEASRGEMDIAGSLCFREVAENLADALQSVCSIELKAENLPADRREAVGDLLAAASLYRGLGMKRLVVVLSLRSWSRSVEACQSDLVRAEHRTAIGFDRYVHDASSEPECGVNHRMQGARHHSLLKPAGYAEQPRMLIPVYRVRHWSLPWRAKFIGNHTKSNALSATSPHNEPRQQSREASRRWGDIHCDVEGVVFR